MKPRFLLDEHINHTVQRQLRRLNVAIEVLAVGEAGAPMAGTSDAELLKWLEAYDYILVTENRSTIPDILIAHFEAGRHIPGLFWIKRGSELGQVVQELYLIWQASSAEEYLDQAIFIPL